jgi:hypothetical protein
VLRKSKQQPPANDGGKACGLWLWLWQAQASKEHQDYTKGKRIHVKISLTTEANRTEKDKI